jgi:hypothetical protein
MFQTENVYGMVNRFGVRVKDQREADTNHILEVVIQLPLTHALADEILPAMAKHLYVRVGGEYKPDPHMTEGVFSIESKTYRVQVRTHPELDPEVTIEGVQLRKIRTKKIEGGVWAIVFTAGWTMAGDKEATALIKRLRKGVYLTMRVMQAALDLQPAAAPATDDGMTANVDKGGNVVSITKKRGRGAAKAEKKRGRSRRTPEDIAREQLAGNGKVEPEDDETKPDPDAHDPADVDPADVDPDHDDDDDGDGARHVSH